MFYPNTIFNVPQVLRGVTPVDIGGCSLWQCRWMKQEACSRYFSMKGGTACAPFIQERKNKGRVY